MKWLIQLNRFLPPVVVMGVIYWFSAQTTLPGPGIIWWDFLLKKTAHMVEYGLLFYSWHRALNWNNEREEWRFLPIFLIVLLYAISDEMHQSFTPGRHPLIRDIGFDGLGSLLVYLKVQGFI